MSARPSRSWGHRGATCPGGERRSPCSPSPRHRGPEGCPVPPSPRPTQTEPLSSDSPGSPQPPPPLAAAEPFSAAMVQRRAHHRALGGSGMHGPSRLRAPGGAVRGGGAESGGGKEGPELPAGPGPPSAPVPPPLPDVPPPRCCASPSSPQRLTGEGCQGRGGGDTRHGVRNPLPIPTLLFASPSQVWARCCAKGEAVPGSCASPHHPTGRRERFAAAPRTAAPACLGTAPGPPPDRPLPALPGTASGPPRDHPVPARLGTAGAGALAAPLPYLSAQPGGYVPLRCSAGSTGKSRRRERRSRVLDALSFSSKPVKDPVQAHPSAALKRSMNAVGRTLTLRSEAFPGAPQRSQAVCGTAECPAGSAFSCHCS